MLHPHVKIFGVTFNYKFICNESTNILELTAHRSIHIPISQLLRITAHKEFNLTIRNINVEAIVLREEPIKLANLWIENNIKLRRVARFPYELENLYLWHNNVHLFDHITDNVRD